MTRRSRSWTSSTASARRVADHWAEVIEESGESTPTEAKEDKAEVVETEAAVVEKGEYVTKRKPELDDETKALLAQARGDRLPPPRVPSPGVVPVPEARGQVEEAARHAQQDAPPLWLPPAHRVHRVPRPGRGPGPASLRIRRGNGLQPVSQLNGIDPKVQAVRIGGTVGARKRGDIIAKADQEGIRVLNR